MRPRDERLHVRRSLEFPDITGTLFQGSRSAAKPASSSTDTVKYRVWLTATGVRLDELARHTKLGSDSELRGLAQGSILVENVADRKTGKWIASGQGQIDVPQGRMYKIPVLLDLVKVLKGQTPDRNAFEEAHATFELKGDLVKVTQLDLLGSAISLGGSGEMDTDGQYVKFEFYTIWSQTLKRWLTTPLGDVTGLLSGGLFKIELTREHGKLTPKAVMLPGRHRSGARGRGAAAQPRGETGRSPECGAGDDRAVEYPEDFAAYDER